MEYNFHINDRGLTYLVTYFTKYCATKSSHVFVFSFLRTATSAQRIYRLTCRLITKALQPNSDFSVDFEGIPQSWTTAPPRLPKEITKMRARKPEDLANNENLTNNSGLGGLTDAPPSANKREKSNVHKFVQRKNQTESIAV